MLRLVFDNCFDVHVLLYYFLGSIILKKVSVYIQINDSAYMLQLKKKCFISFGTILKQHIKSHRPIVLPLRKVTGQLSTGQLSTGQLSAHRSLHLT